jgi:type VI secretion system Hcp family effector
MLSPRKFFAAAFFVALFCGSFTVRAALDVYVSISGVPGDSLEEMHEGWIKAFSFSHKISYGPGPVKPEHDDIVISKLLDQTSPALTLCCLKSTNFSKIVIDFVRSGVDEKRYYTVVLSGAQITSVASSGSDEIFEQITIRYDRIDWTYSSLDDNGVLTDYFSWWDLKENTGGPLEPDNDHDGNPDSSDPDDDDDGMTDVYENANGLNPFVNDAAGDLDHDGMSNYDEFIAGTAANNANSVLRVTRANLVGTASQITWSSIAGKTYQIYSSTNVVGPYTFFSSVPSAGTGETSTTITNSAGQRFFRIRIVP